MTKYNAVSYNVIYVYSIDDDAHRGYLKIGKTSFYSKNSIAQLPPNSPEIQSAAHACIYSQTHRATIDYKLLFCDIAIRPITMNDGSVQYQPFDDFLVRDVIQNSVDNYLVKKFAETNRDSEWVKCELDDVKKAVNAIKEGRNRIPSACATQIVELPKTPAITLREEQAENVERTINTFKNHDKMLWDCKMRYGKTVTAYEVIRRMNEKGLFKKVIVITHRPAVEDGWSEDHGLIFPEGTHVFIDKTNGRDEFNGALDAENDRNLKQVVEDGKPFIYFASIQDLRGSARVGGKHNKNNAVFDLAWDLLIIDEAHEGTQTELGDAVISAIKKDNTKVLSLSGTPYNIVKDYQENNVFTWTYVDEQTKKKEWAEKHPDEKNPYEELPTMNIFTFDLTEQMPESYRYVTEDSAFSFREFFKTWTGDKEKDYRDIPEGKDVGDFVHEEDVFNFLTLISNEDANSNYPFATDEFRDMFSHTFWLVPGVAAAKALSAMLKSHPRFSEYNIINIAGDGDEERPYDEALGLVKSAIKVYPKTITISCGKLTTGITVREWTGIMMLSGSASTSAGGYMQAIFRVQSPGCVNGKQKTNCYVFDFAPDRTLKVLAEVHSINNKRGQNKDEDAKQQLGDFLNFCPVIAVEGTAMRTYDVPELMRQIKRISVEAAVKSGFDDDSIYKSDAGLIANDLDAEILKKLSWVVNPKGKSQKQTEIDINKLGLTNEQRTLAEQAAKKKKKELTPEEKEALDKLRKQKEEQRKMFNLLRAVSIRLPLLFYGADADITEIIHLEDFVKFVDDESWSEFMPTGLRKELFLEILRYYDEDVVVGAGLRIRKIAKAADELPPTQRAKKIVELLSTFKNPDKETVLTPWRVVNMHLGETLGGYNFYDESYTEELEKPHLIEQGNITSDILLNENAKILELNSKSGLYPMYMAYSIYMMYVDGDEKKLPLEKAQEIWFRTLAKNIFVLCKTKMARSITIRTLAGYSGKPVNATYLPKLVEERMKDIPKLSNKIRNPKTWGKEGEGKMKFDAIVGNPPYQEQSANWESKTNGQPRRSNIFPLFQELADATTAGYSSLIYPGARWIHRSGKGTEKFGLQQINDNHLEKLIFYPNANEVFSSVAIADGLTIVFKNNKKDTPGFKYCYRLGKTSVEKDMDNPGKELMPLDPLNSTIIEKITRFVNNNSLKFIHDRVLIQKLFGIESEFVEKNPKAVRLYDETITIDYSKEIKLYANNKAGKAGRTTWYVTSPDVIPNNRDLIYEWQVVVSSANAGGQKRDNQLEIMDNHTAFGRSRVALGTFKTEKEAINFYNYVKTKLIRYCFLLTDEALTSLGKKVPDLLDYSSKNNIVDFSKDINEQLYNLIGLNKSEIELIESTIQ